MEHTDYSLLPEVELYGIGPAEASAAAPLLTREALEAISTGEAFGLALVEEGEARCAVCAQLSTENDALLEILSLYTAPAFRLRGLGGTLLLELLEHALEATDAAVRWVTATFSPDTVGMKELLERTGFSLQSEETPSLWQLPISELTASRQLSVPAAAPAGCSLRTFAQLSDYDIHTLLDTLRQNEIDDLSPASMRECAGRVSYVLLDSRNAPRACALFSPLENNGLYLSQFFTAEGSASAAMAVLRAAAEALEANYPPNALLKIPVLTQSSTALLKHLLPQAEPVCSLNALLDLRTLGL